MGTPMPTNSEKIRSIKELVEAGLQRVPAGYIRPMEERAACAAMCGGGSSQPDLPVISLDNSDSELQEQIGLACAEWGIFQVTNHGVSTALRNQLWKAAYHFFSLPTETKLDIISKDSSCPLLFFTGFCPHEKVREWKDTLGFKPNPAMNEMLLPHFLRGPMLEFQKATRALARRLAEAIFSSLELDAKHFRDLHINRETMAFNYYPPCPQPDLTYGLSSHSDFGSVTIIMQDEVKGLQVRRGDAWIDVKPSRDAFIVMIGDQIEILTNGHYKSVEHRVVTNETSPRMSIACFYGPREHDNVRPLDKFMSEDCPMRYKETKFSDYLKHGFSKALCGKSNLQFSTLKRIPSCDS